MKCKNENCNNETVGKRIYCSLRCRNIYINKNCLDYKKVSASFKKKRDDIELTYLKNPKRCRKCQNIIPRNSRNDLFCSVSCSNASRNVTWNNKMSNSRHEYLVKLGIRKNDEKENYKLICKECNSEFCNKNKKIKYCSFKCRYKKRRENTSEYQRYKSASQFKFSLNTYPNEFDFDLIEKYGWYSPSNKNNNISGISRDHMLSIRDGFDLKIDPILLSHPANCKLMIHSENITKNRKSSIDYNELLKRIEEFDLKYKISDCTEES